MAEAIPDDTKLFTRFLKATNRLYSRNFHTVEQFSACPLPDSGPAIVIANHISSADPFLIQATSHRVIRWMMAKEFYDIPVVKTLCRGLGFIPVIRTARDATSLKAALRTLHDGNVLGIFPEGRISPTKDLLPFQPGLGMIAQRTGAPVFPVAVEGVPRNLSLLAALLLPHDGKILYGPPLRIQSRTAQIPDFRTAVQTLQLQALAANSHRIIPAF
jgi:1-acyl-sn-glycerol-3-phosphate acyltransferase